MVGQKDCGEQQRRKVNTPEKDIDLESKGYFDKIS